MENQGFFHFTQTHLTPFSGSGLALPVAPTNLGLRKLTQHGSMQSHTHYFQMFFNLTPSMTSAAHWRLQAPASHTPAYPLLLALILAP